jgi:hypothetical protein
MDGFRYQALTARLQETTHSLSEAIPGVRPRSGKHHFGWQ